MPIITRSRFLTFFILCFMGMVSCVGRVTAGLPETIIKIKPSIVAIGTVEKTRRPPTKFFGTGFVIGDGHTVVTNAHVIPAVLDVENLEKLVVIVGNNHSQKAREAEQVALDVRHDLALLKISGPPLPAMQLGDSNLVMAGESYAFTGFPLGTILGFYPVTHRGMISSITPIVLPARSSHTLTVEMIRRLKAPFNIFQLDATAYPGNSGSPLYDLRTGKVIAVLNMVFVKQTKETVIQHPSGISYAIPANYIKALLKTIK